MSYYYKWIKFYGKLLINPNIQSLFQRKHNSFQMFIITKLSSKNQKLKEKKLNRSVYLE